MFVVGAYYVSLRHVPVSGLRCDRVVCYPMYDLCTRLGYDHELSQL